ncbi:MAG: hypothetical protein KDI55_22670, partial [Anaerolineae bacterium]|nr:hypothetical protein [Anaerolineae bacterium]
MSETKTQPSETANGFFAGTVTFLFTDIESSTQLLAQLRDQYTDLLAEHHRLLRDAFARWNGREMDTQG